jgi:hypothetical protein
VSTLDRQRTLEYDRRPPGIGISAIGQVETFGILVAKGRYCAEGELQRATGRSQRSTSWRLSHIAGTLFRLRNNRHYAPVRRNYLTRSSVDPGGLWADAG